VTACGDRSSAPREVSSARPLCPAPCSPPALRDPRPSPGLCYHPSDFLNAGHALPAPRSRRPCRPVRRAGVRRAALLARRARGPGQVPLPRQGERGPDARLVPTPLPGCLVPDRGRGHASRVVGAGRGGPGHGGAGARAQPLADRDGEEGPIPPREGLERAPLRPRTTGERRERLEPGLFRKAT
jgi:hypothetical protein